MVFPEAEPESLAQLRGDCARMAPYWPAARAATGSQCAARSHAPARPPSLRGVRVPPGTARMLEGMSEYGD
ncbi:hypothetical protein E0L36_04910 [Streptomyces sp. AJS327]|nr:hypothetical protein [Streptomyces sp. AJS327]MBA0050261.1 hypothetical protein [Streptomyces sp. AJS327]